MHSEDNSPPEGHEDEALLVGLPSSALAEDNPSHPQEGEAEDIIDPIQQMRNNNIVPLLAVLDKMDLTQLVDGKPLLSKLCAMGVPLDLYLKEHPTPFPRDADNRTPLHEAIQADDAVAAKWCLQRDNGNIRDNFGNTPILEAIKLGRRSCFLLCLQYQYYDSEAPHTCASHNRLWQIQALHRLGYDVVAVRDSQHFTPLERAVQNYGYDVAEFLTRLSPDVKPGYLSTKTDSTGIIRLVQRVKDSTSFITKTLTPLLYPIVNIFIISLAVQSLPCYSGYFGPLAMIMIAIIAHYVLMWILGCRRGQKKYEVDFNHILRPPQFPPIDNVCAQCLLPSEPGLDHCNSCGQCVPGLHFHSFVCVSNSNQVFWFMLEGLWTLLLWWLKTIIESQASYNSLLVSNLSSRWLFGWGAMLEWGWGVSWVMPFWLFYLWAFLVYQFCCCFELFSMMVLHRTHRQINNTQNYPHLYRVARTSDGAFKSQQIRLMQDGLCKGIFRGIRNVITYFFK